MFDPGDLCPRLVVWRLMVKVSICLLSETYALGLQAETTYFF